MWRSVKRFVPAIAAAPALCAVQQRQYIPPPTPLSFGGFGGTRTDPPWPPQRRVGPLLSRSVIRTLGDRCVSTTLMFYVVSLSLM